MLWHSLTAPPQKQRSEIHLDLPTDQTATHELLIGQYTHQQQGHEENKQLESYFFWASHYICMNCRLLKQYSLLLNLTRKLESSLGCNWVFPYWYMFTETCQWGNQEKPLKLNSNFVLYIQKVNKLKATGVCPKLPEHGNSLDFIIIFKGDRVYPATLSQDWWRYNMQREKAGLHSQRVYGHREFQKKKMIVCDWWAT